MKDRAARLAFYQIGFILGCACCIAVLVFDVPPWAALLITFAVNLLGYVNLSTVTDRAMRKSYTHKESGSSAYPLPGDQSPEDGR